MDKTKSYTTFLSVNVLFHLEVRYIMNVDFKINNTVDLERHWWSGIYKQC